MSRAMRGYLAAIILLTLSINVFAQENPDVERSPYNQIKFNFLTLTGGKFSFEYERLLTESISVGTAVSFRPDKQIPFRSVLKSYVNDPSLDYLVDDFNSGNFSITPEVRFYTSKRGPFRGFYIAPYVKYVAYKANLPFDFDVDISQAGEPLYQRTETIPLSGQVKAVTGGVSIGVNFKLSRNLHLDWRLVGPGYGSAKGNIEGTMTLDTEEQEALNIGLADLKEEVKSLPLAIDIDYEVRSNGATIRLLRSPWAGIRSGLSLAYRF